MFSTIFIKEIKSHFRHISFYLYGAIIFILVFLYAQNTDPNNVIFNLRHGKEYNLAAIKIAKMFINWSIAGIFFIMVMVGRSVVKDFQVNIHDFFFTNQIKKWEYLGGRFAGSYLAGIMIFLFIPLALSMGNMVLPKELQAPVYWQTYLYPYLFIIIPNIFIIAVFSFSLSTLSRKSIYTYLSSIVLVILYVTIILGTKGIKSDWIRIMIDPFGQNAIDISSQFWTISDMNSKFMPFSNLFIINRIIWFIFSLGLLSYTFIKFKMTHDLNTKSKGEIKPTDTIIEPQVERGFSVAITNNYFSKMCSMIILEWRRVIIHPAFLIIFGLGLIQWISNTSANMDGSGSSAYPFTSWLVGQTMHLWMYMVPITILFGGLIVWREKEYKTQDLYYTLAISDTQRCLAKIFAILGIQFSYLFLSMLAGMIYQIVFNHFYNIEPLLYFTRFFLMEMLNYLQITILVVLIQVLVRNKMLGFFVSALLFIADIIIFDIYKFDFSLLRSSHFPNFTYSNLNGFNGFSQMLINYGIYWFLFSILLTMLSIFIWKSSENDSINQRFKYSLQKISQKQKYLFFTTLILFVIMGSYIAYNRYIVNSYISKNNEDREIAAYEKQCDKYINLPELTVTDVKLKIDLYPSTQSAQIRGRYIVKNENSRAVDTLIVSQWNQKRAQLKEFIILKAYTEIEAMRDYRAGVFKLKEKLEPGDSLIISFYVDYQTKGFTDNNVETEIVKNGTLMCFGGRGNYKFMPQIGINKDIFLSKEELRVKHKLPKYKSLASLEKADKSKGFSSFNLINYYCEISTERGQIALTNGELIKQWVEADRSHFIYKPLFPISYELALCSGIYEVKKEKYKNTEVEVYYNKKHDFNINRIIHGFSTSIKLNSIFKEYPHKTLRIIETPAYMTYAAARAFPTMYIWNEDAGFISKVDDKNGIDNVFAISAHEMAHHWWGYELMPAEVEGLYLPIESMAEFMNLMAIEKAFSKHKALEYLAIEKKKYLKQRGRAKEGEVPLYKCHHNQSYLAYQKGMIQLYALKEYIGEAAMFKGLKAYYDKYANTTNNYPVSTDMLNSINEVSPDSLKYLIDDLFKKITFYDLKAYESKTIKTNSGFYESRLKVHAKKYYADEYGKESEVKFDEYVYIKAYDKQGDEIYSRIIKVKGQEAIINILTRQIPYKLGIDPDGLLMDKNKEDNLINIKN